MSSSPRAAWEVRRFASFEEMDATDAEFWRRIPRSDRIMQAWKLSRDCYALARREESAMEPDFLDMLTALNAAAVKYLLVGAHALAWHGRPRATGDLDIWIEASPENAQ